MQVKNDLNIYEVNANTWWHENSKSFRSLQNVNKIRARNIIKELNIDHKSNVADLGCGGGLLSIPIIETGATLTGIDLSQGSINQAKIAAQGKGIFRQGDIRNTNLENESFNAVILSDILEHLPDYYLALQEASRILKKNGKLYVSTINRNWLSYLAAILLAEGLNYIPKGTHDWKLFIKPEELRKNAKTAGLRQVKIQGEQIELLKTLVNNKIFVKDGKVCLISYWVIFEKI